MRRFLLNLALALSLSSGCNAAFAHHNHGEEVAGGGSGSANERIIVMRHAEKPDDENNPDLAPAGVARANKLPAFVTANYGRPDFIFAAKDSENSSRPRETALPLSTETGVPIDTSFKNKNFAELAQVLLSDPRFQGKTIFVFWHHGNIPELAHDLGAKAGTVPDKWNSSIYNQFIEFDYDGGHRPMVTMHTEPF